MQDSSSPKVLRVKNTFFDYEDDADVVPPIVNTRRRTCPDLKDRQQAEDPAQDDEEPETPRCRPASEKPVLLGSPGQAARDAAPVLPEEAAGSKRVFTKNTFIHTEEEELKTPCNRRYHTCPEPDDGNDHVSDDEDAASSSDEKPEVSRAAQSSRRVSFNALPRVEDPLDSESEGPTPRPGNRSMYKTEDLQECLFAGKFGDYVQDGAIPTSSGYDVGARRNTEDYPSPKASAASTFPGASPHFPVRIHSTSCSPGVPLSLADATSVPHSAGYTSMAGMPVQIPPPPMAVPPPHPAYAAYAGMHHGWPAMPPAPCPWPMAPAPGPSSLMGAPWPYYPYPPVEHHYPPGSPVAHAPPPMFSHHHPVPPPHFYMQQQQQQQHHHQPMMVPPMASVGRVRPDASAFGTAPASSPMAAAAATASQPAGAEDEAGGAAGSRARGGARRLRLWAHIYLHMQVAGFDLVPRLIGRGGCNMRRIADQTSAKIRIRGRGSGHFEIEGEREAPTPLMVAVTTDKGDQDAFRLAIAMTLQELRNVEVRFHAHCQKQNIVHEGPCYSIGLLPENGKEILADIIEGVPMSTLPSRNR
mmetsp:Transcript_45766/g.146890  ORF Transcript_45766/g.146890 Transcript_45766/m.146890 type:complete len:584 (+) Transcript_45766:77-1828(+)